MNPAVRARFIVALLFALATGPAFAELKGTNATFYSWDDDPSVLKLQNSNSSIILDGKWHPFFAALNFDNNAVVPGTQSNGVVQCSATDTDGNGRTGTSTPWAGLLQLSVDSRDTGSAVINGFPQTRCWELAVCDRETNGTGSFAGSDLSTTPRYRRFAVDVTAQGACPTPTANAANGYVNPLISNGFITLLSQDVVAPCDQSGRCDQKIDTTLYVTLDRDCDGAIDDNDGNQVNNDPAAGNLNLIGSGGAGRIPLPVGNNDPQICFFAEGKKPDFTQNPQWQGNIQARITAPPGGSGEKTVNHSIIASPVVGDVGDLPTPYPAAPHVTNAFTNANPFIGSAPDTDTSSFFTPLADGDDVNNVADEAGVILPPDTISDNDGSNTIYTATVTATNQSGVPAQLCGWFDFDQDLTLDNAPNTSTTASDPNFTLRSEAGERSCRQVPTGTANSPLSLSWSIPASAQASTGDFYFRFRISFDQDMFDPILISAVGGLNSGEVQDHLLQGVTSLPVSVAAFDSSITPDGLKVDWLTVSETENIGFHIWGTGPNGLYRLTDTLIPARDHGDPLLPGRYSITLPGIDAGDVSDLALTAVDLDGKEDMYGLFDVGRRYGQKVETDLIPWPELRQRVDERRHYVTAARKDSRDTRLNGKPEAGRGTASVTDHYADLVVAEPGLQTIGYEDLAAAGLDLSGVASGDIAVTVKGQPVARDIVDARGVARHGNAPFGAGDAIRFWGDAPTLPDALYIDSLVYRVQVQSEKAIEASRFDRAARDTTARYRQRDQRDDDESYQFASPLADPWFAAQLRADRNNRHTTTFNIDEHLVAGQSGRVIVTVGGLTDFPENPDHHVVVSVNGVTVGERLFEGQSVETLTLDVPPDAFRVGANTVEVTAPGGSAAPFDLFLVDTVELQWPRTTVATNDRLQVDGPITSDGLSASGFAAATPVAAYARRGNDLIALRVATAGDSIKVPAAPAAESYWLSNVDAMQRPVVSVVGEQTDLLAGRTGNLIVIAHPAFLPIAADEPHPLNDYLAQRRSEGWQPQVFDVTAIQARYGHGMALPQAVTAFLADAEQSMDFEHVLLIGGDSYDYTNNLGLGSLSFIPTRYVATNAIEHTPSDAMLTDLDGDHFPDKAIGRWPVRTLDDLSAIVTKTLQWPAVAERESVVWVTDSEDSRTGSFRAQADRMTGILLDAGWPADRAESIYWGEASPQPGESMAAATRRELFDSIEQGRAITGFVGHGSPGMWTFQGLLRPADLKQLYNEGNPTLIGTLTCYTSYFVSPSAESVAHRWMNGYRVDAAGRQIPGVPNGAAAIHGAATLSDYAQNEIFASVVLEQQLQGATLGQAIQAARHEARNQVMPDLIKNWTLLGDPTLKLQ